MSGAATTAGAIATAGYAATVDLPPPPAPTVAVTGSDEFDVAPTLSLTSGGGTGNGTFRYSTDGATWVETTETSIELDLCAGCWTVYAQEQNVEGDWSASGSDVVEIQLRPSQVADGVDYDEGQKTGTLASGDAPPTAPAIVVESGVATVSGADAGTTNTVYVLASDGEAWSAAGSVTGNGDVDLSGLAAGVYWPKVRSDNGAGYVETVGSPFGISDAAAEYSRSDFGDDFLSEADHFFSEFGETITYMRGSRIATLTAVRGSAQSEYVDDAGYALAVGDASWSFRADDLDFGAGPVEPRLRDQIRTSRGEIHRVLHPGRFDGEAIYRTVPTSRKEVG